MIQGIGVDMVPVARCAQWHRYTKKSLLKILSAQEIEYCMQHSALSAQRFAVRLAAKEAFYKALCAACADIQMPLRTICRFVEVVHDTRGVPRLHVQWQALLPANSKITAESIVVQCSLTHSDCCALAMVVIVLNDLLLL